MFSGIDIVQIARLESLVEGREGRLERLFSPAEIAYCRRKGQGAVASYAGLYAAKEAFFKAHGIEHGMLSFHDIEILNDKNGKPKINYPNTFISIAHENDYAIAYVVVEEG